MITKEQNTALLAVGNAALANEDWADYADYCFSREKGLRKQAFTYLNKFLKSAETWTPDKKIQFLKFLFPLFERVREADYGAFPQPLRDKLVKPALMVWCNTEQTDNRPFRWFGKYYLSQAHLFRALELNPADDLARQTLLWWWTDDIAHSVHHLPQYYIGEPSDKIRLGDEVKAHIRQLATPELRRCWARMLEEDLELVRNYMDWQASAHPDFEKWGQESKKRTGHGLAAYFYEK